MSAIAAAVALSLLGGGCATRHPPPLPGSDLASAQTFPYYRLYWVGRVFENQPVTAADGLAGYDPGTGDGIQYGDCGRGQGPLHTGACAAPLRIITVIYSEHCNRLLGAQRNIVIRGVPATVFDGGRSIEVYSGRVAIDVYADSPSRALSAVLALRPLNAPGSDRANLPPPAYHPGLIPPAPAYRVAPTVTALDQAGVPPPTPCSPRHPPASSSGILRGLALTDTANGRQRSDTGGRRRARRAAGPVARAGARALRSRAGR